MIKLPKIAQPKPLTLERQIKKIDLLLTSQVFETDEEFYAWLQLPKQRQLREQKRELLKLQEKAA